MAPFFFFYRVTNFGQINWNLVVFHHPNYLDVETHYLSTEIKTKAIKREDDF
jgi:hypothetical protein